MHRGQFRKRSSPEEINRGVGMLGSGVWQWPVAGILNVSQSVISRMWNRHLTHGDPSHRQGQGCDSATTQSQDGFLLIQSRRQCFQNATSLNNEFRNKTGVRISTQTLRNRLQEFGLNARRPVIRVPLTSSAGQVRLCQNVRLTIRDWPQVIFTDESRFCLEFIDRSQLVWRMPKERFDELNVAEHDHYDKGSVMVRAGISVNGKN